MIQSTRTSKRSSNAPLNNEETLLSSLRGAHTTNADTGHSDERLVLEQDPEDELFSPSADSLLALEHFGQISDEDDGELATTSGPDEESVSLTEDEFYPSIDTSPDTVADPIGWYLQEAGKYPLLTREEESLIGAQIKHTRHQLEVVLFKNDFVALRAVAMIRSLLKSTDRLDSYFVFKRDGSDGLGGIAGASQRFNASIKTIERLLADNQERVALMYDPMLSTRVRQEIARQVYRDRGKVVTLLCETRARRSTLKDLMQEFLVAAKDPQTFFNQGGGAEMLREMRTRLCRAPISLPHTVGSEYVLLFGEDSGRLERRITALQGCSDRYEAARTTLFQSNLRLVVAIAKQWADTPADLLDRIQDGNEGLGLAVDMFEADRGFKFSTYATPWITSRIRKERYEGSHVVRRKVNTESIVSRTRRGQDEFFKRFGRFADEHDLEAFLKMPLKDVQLGLRLVRPVRSLDTPMGDREDERGVTLGALLLARAEETVEDANMRAMIANLVDPQSNVINQRESRVVKLRHGIFSDIEHEELSARHGVNTRGGLTLQEVGNILGVTRERVRQIESRAYEKLQRVLERSERVE
jgi:RNA polymerase primary sigma factor